MLVRFTELYLGLGIGVWLGLSMLMSLIAVSDFLFMLLPSRGDHRVQFYKRGAVFRQRLVAAWSWPLAVFSPSGRKRLKKAWKGIL
jgi:hypothetical protein